MKIASIEQARAQTVAPPLAGAPVPTANLRRRCRGWLGLLALVSLSAPLAAQDTTQAYPWRFSNFPYLTASPNDGAMLMYRGVLFRQSRWNDRVSVHSQVALEGGYSTKDAWVVRARGDFPRLANGWRMQLLGQADKEPNYFFDRGVVTAANRQIGALEVTRTIGGPFMLALRGEATHVRRTFSVADNAGSDIGTVQTSSTDVRARIALVVDRRDREYDTRSGTLLQGGYFLGSATNYSSGAYHGEYATASAWIPVNPTTRATARAAVRFSDRLVGDAVRVIPAWEDDVLVTGGPESNRALPIAAQVNNCVKLLSAEIRHDVKVFPGGAFAVLAFVDASQTDDCGRETIRLTDPNPTPGPVSSQTTNWIAGPGAGVAIRLLRNAVLTATIGVAQSKARVYVSSGWSW